MTLLHATHFKETPEIWAAHRADNGSRQTGQAGRRSARSMLRPLPILGLAPRRFRRGGCGGRFEETHAPQIDPIPGRPVSSPRPLAGSPGPMPLPSASRGSAATRAGRSS